MKADMHVRDSLVKLDDSFGNDDDEGSSMSVVGEVIHVKQVMRAVPIHVKFEWRIEKFDILMAVCKPGEPVISKHLFFNPAPQVVWLIYCYPNGYRPECRNTVCVFLDQVMPADDEKGTGGLEAQVSSRFCLIEEDGHHRWLTPGNPSISHDDVRDAMHMDGSVTIGVDFKYLPPCRLLCNDEALETRMMMSGPASIQSRATTVKEEREKSVIVSGGGELGEGHAGMEGRETREVITPPNTPTNGLVSSIPGVNQKSESDEIQQNGVNSNTTKKHVSSNDNGQVMPMGDMDFMAGLFRQLVITPPSQRQSTSSTDESSKQQQGKKGVESFSGGYKLGGYKKSKKRGIWDRGVCQLF